VERGGDCEGPQTMQGIAGREGSQGKKEDLHIKGNVKQPSEPKPAGKGLFRLRVESAGGCTIGETAHREDGVTRTHARRQDLQRSRGGD